MHSGWRSYWFNLNYFLLQLFIYFAIFWSLLIRVNNYRSPIIFSKIRRNTHEGHSLITFCLIVVKTCFFYFLTFKYNDIHAAADNSSYWRKCTIPTHLSPVNKCTSNANANAVKSHLPHWISHLAITFLRSTFPRSLNTINRNDRCLTSNRSESIVAEARNGTRPVKVSSPLDLLYSMSRRNLYEIERFEREKKKTETEVNSYNDKTVPTSVLVPNTSRIHGTRSVETSWKSIFDQFKLDWINKIAIIASGQLPRGLFPPVDCKSLWQWMKPAVIQFLSRGQRYFTNVHLLFLRLAFLFIAGGCSVGASVVRRY